MSNIKTYWLHLLVGTVLVFGLGYLVGSDVDPIKETVYVSSETKVNARKVEVPVPPLELPAIPGKKIVHDTVIKDVPLPYVDKCPAFTFNATTTTDTVTGIADCARQQILNLAIRRSPLIITVFDTVTKYSEKTTEVRQNSSFFLLSAFGSYEPFKRYITGGAVAELCVGNVTLYSAPSFDFTNSVFNANCGLKLKLLER